MTSGPSPIGELVMRRRSVVTGTVVRAALRDNPGLVLEVLLEDPTGSILAEFYGRTSLAGVVPGVRLLLEGTPRRHRGHSCMLNPLWCILDERPCGGGPGG